MAGRHPHANRPGAIDPRVIAIRALFSVIIDGRSLDAVWHDRKLFPPAVNSRAYARECIAGVLRWLPRYQFILARLLMRPLKAKDRDLEMLLLVGLHQLFGMDTPDHAAVSETVNACDALGKPWAKALTNGVLRSALRDKDSLLQAVERNRPAMLAHPAWLIDAMQTDWPQDWESICQANNGRAPMTLRVNLRRTSRETCLQDLAKAGLDAIPTRYSECGITLAAPIDIKDVPGFSAGLLSVQDEAAQLAAPLLDVVPAHRILDACAAPGGKAAHIAERYHPAELIALDISAERCARIEQNRARLDLNFAIATGDAANPATWWDGRQFERILLDAPCSALGIIRRQPDIKLHRRPADLDSLPKLQGSILEGLWPTLAVGGKLLYVTCSIMHAENDAVIDAFCDRHDDVICQTVAQPWGRQTPRGRQIVPGETTMDGFYYALLEKV